MKARLNCSGGYSCFKEGDIVECIKGKDLPKKHACANIASHESDLFCKGNDGKYWYMYDYEFEILEDEPSEKEPLLIAATEAKKLYDAFIKSGFSKKQAFDFVSVVLAESLTK